MINFTEYNSGSLQLDKFNSDVTIISMPALNRLLFDSAQSDYAFIIPNKTSSETNYNIRKYFQKIQHGLYPVACKEQNEFQRIYVLTKKPRTSSGDFQNILQESYVKNKCFDIIYVNANNSISVYEHYLKTDYTESFSLSLLNELIKEHLNKKLQVCGLEIPLNKDYKELYRKNSLLAMPLLSEEFKYAKNWKNILNE